MEPHTPTHLHRFRPGSPPRRYRTRTTSSRLDRAYAAHIAGTLASVGVLLSVLLGLPVALLIAQRAVWQGFDVAGAVEQPLSLPVFVLAAIGAGWLLWTSLVAATVADTVAALSRGPRHARLLPAPLRATVTALAGSLLVATTSSTVNAASPPAVTFAYTAGPLTAALPPPSYDTVTALPHLTATTTAAPRTGTNPHPAVTVRHGDCLWSISKQHLGDPRRWPEIFNLNKSRIQANGYALTDPNEIHVGWTLTLPASDPDPEPTAATEATTAATETGPATAAPSSSTTAGPTTTNSSSIPSVDPTDARDDQHVGVRLPSQGWISLGLAATIAVVAGLLRLHRRRHARLTAPIPLRTGPTRPPAPSTLALVDAVDRRSLGPDTARNADHPPTAVAAPIGVNTAGTELSLFDLPGIALDGPGAVPVARAVLGSVLATNTLGPAATRPVVVTTPATLARLLPDDATLTGLDPHGVTYDGERLLLLADTAAAVTHAEEELIGRRRLLDTFDAESITELNARTDHAETQPPYVLLVEADDHHTGRVTAIAAHRTALQLHVVVLGTLDGIPTITTTTDGTPTTDTADTAALLNGGRLSTLTAADLGQLLTMIADAAARPEPGTDVEETTEPAGQDQGTPATLLPIPDPPTPTSDAPALVHLTVLGPVTLTTATGPVTTGMRNGSYAVLALLAAHPHGRTLEQIAADLHPDTDPAAAVNRIRTDINTARRVLRTATGTTAAMFVVHDPASRRYRLDPDMIDVDLWRMLAAIGRANTATDDTTALAALHKAADLYAGDLGEGQDRTWITDHATTHRHQILSVYARIAELLEADQPDAAVAALETALQYDPVNEELYQRIMRIHGRQHRPDAVRRTLRRLEAQLAEPSEATRRIADRQLRPVPAGAR
jgi:DNA-binding SARP family transcriptional activator